MAVLDKADFGIITMPISGADKDKLQSIMNEGFNQYPTHGHHIIKNRGGKWVRVIVWVYMNLDNVEVIDCFVTTQEFEACDSIRPYTIEF